MENYEFLDDNHIESYVKYNYFHKEQTKKFKSDISRIENLYYNIEQDCYICPMGQKMQPVGNPQKRMSDLGYEYEVVIYQAFNCNNCPLRGACHKQKGNRNIEVNKQLIKFKQQTRENLLSEQGRTLRGRRCSEVEQTFGQIKWNKKFTRFLLRGIPKVSVEMGLIAIAHNLQKLAMLLIKCNMTVFCQDCRYLLLKLWRFLASYTAFLFANSQTLKNRLVIKKYYLENIEMKKAA